MSKITIDLVGPSAIGGKSNYGLGNQMFQIATVLSLAKDGGYDPVFPDLRSDEYGKYTKNIFKRLDISGNKDFVQKIYREPEFYYSPISPQSNMSISGYFQSEKYFKHNRDHILNYFAPDDEIVDYIMNKYGKILKNNPVSCHIRRGDYLHLSREYSQLSLDGYYKDAFFYFDSRDIIIFSDDIGWCKNHISGDSIIFSEEEDYIELYMMSMCQDSIIANSSFSWWGAWLNKNSNKKIISPLHWFGSGLTLDDKDLVPEEWIRI